MRPPFEKIHWDSLKPERRLKEALAALRVDFVGNPRWLKGRPDIAMPGVGLAVFVDGCFWHKCPRHWKASKTNQDFWQAKADRNVQRDIEVERVLAAGGWTVLRVWEHQVRTEAAAEVVARRIEALAGRLAGRRGAAWWMPERVAGQLPLGT